MSARITLFICDNDTDFQQELINQFATSIEDYKLIGLKSMDELLICLNNSRFKIGEYYIVASSALFDYASNHESTSQVFKIIARKSTIKQVIIYTPDEERFRKKHKFTRHKNVKCIPQNDFTFFRIQNSIRTYSNVKEYNQSKLGLAFSLVAFFGFSIWFYLI
ncbi:MAG: hypothetical protein PHU27_11065 [Salinivirgaceae bacterium]|nr:hypothetical protein [Salinivirgaceae bacterium]MDD4746873.1 hypothetical protein [Salinivirgaceae bacterium]MDY0279398.1 hypothetical protein [Salinivirgaceae bacterium]